MSKLKRRFGLVAKNGTEMKLIWSDIGPLGMVAAINCDMMTIFRKTANLVDKQYGEYGIENFTISVRYLEESKKRLGVNPQTEDGIAALLASEYNIDMKSATEQMQKVGKQAMINRYNEVTSIYGKQLIGG